MIPLHSLSELDLADLSFLLGLRPVYCFALGLYFEYCLFFLLLLGYRHCSEPKYFLLSILDNCKE